MPTRSNERLCKLAQAGDTAARDILLENNLGFIRKIALEQYRSMGLDENDIGMDLGQHRTIAEASAVESPIRQETIGFPAHFFARAHNFKPPGRACQPEADSPMRT